MVAASETGDADFFFVNREHSLPYSDVTVYLYIFDI